MPSMGIIYVKNPNMIWTWNRVVRYQKKKNQQRQNRLKEKFCVKQVLMPHNFEFTNDMRVEMRKKGTKKPGEKVRKA